MRIRPFLHNFFVSHVDLSVSIPTPVSAQQLAGLVDAALTVQERPKFAYNRPKSQDRVTIFGPRPPGFPLVYYFYCCHLGVPTAEPLNPEVFHKMYQT